MSRLPGLKLTVSLAVILGLAACGSSGSSSTSSSHHRSAAGAPVHIYRAKLSGSAEVSRGASNGTGDMIVAVHHGARLCWRFAHLHGFTDATTARIYSGATGKAGAVVATLSSGPRLHHQGCVHANPSVVRAIEQRPQDYYVNIHSVQYPRGAVRAQL